MVQSINLGKLSYRELDELHRNLHYHLEARETARQYNKPHICPHCGRTLISQSNYVFRDDNEFWCDNCNIIFFTKDDKIVDEWQK